MTRDEDIAARVARAARMRVGAARDLLVER
jgi:hypothetical protein